MDNEDFLADSQTTQQVASDNLIINMGDVDVADADGPPPIPPGRYPAIVDELTFGASQSSGNLMITWKFRISDGEHKGKSLRDYTVIQKADKEMDRRGIAKCKKYIQVVTPEYNLSGQFSPVEYVRGGYAVGKPCSLVVRVTPASSKGPAGNSINDISSPEAATSEGLW